MATSIRFPAPGRFTTETEFLEKGVYRWLCRITGTELYRHYKTGEVLPAADDLVDWLDSVASPKIKKYVADYHDHAGRGEWSGEQYDRQLRRAVAFCLENHTPEVIHERAVKGGRKSKASPRFTLPMFWALEDGLTVEEQAAELGCSLSQVYKLRALAKAYDPVLGGEFSTPTSSTSPTPTPVAAPGPLDYLLD